MASIICFDPSARHSALVSAIATDAGLDVTFCSDPDEALAFLGEFRPFLLMLVVDEPGDHGAGVNFIKRSRLLSNRFAMPIIFNMAERDLALSREAMHAGATEVLLHSDIDQLKGLMEELSRHSVTPFPSGRVLLVEDSDVDAIYMEEICGELGLSIDRCTSVEQGMARLLDQNYQLAIIDIVLQGVQSGLALVRHIRQQPSPLCYLPIIVLSGFNDVARRIEALRNGCDDFLSKPFAEEEFVWRLQRMMMVRAMHDVGLGEAQNHDLDIWQQQGLSLRESQVCEALVRGDADRKIASDLHISFWTVRTHISKIFSKLGVLNRREMMARYLRVGQ